MMTRPEERVTQAACVSECVLAESEHSVFGDKKWKISNIWTKFWGQFLFFSLCLHEDHASEEQSTIWVQAQFDLWLMAIFCVLV